jgi:predicted alpha/beta hydrolase family esterase
MRRQRMHPQHQPSVRRLQPDHPDKHDKPDWLDELECERKTKKPSADGFFVSNAVFSTGKTAFLTDVREFSG